MTSNAITSKDVEESHAEEALSLRNALSPLHIDQPQCVVSAAARSANGQTDDDADDADDTKSEHHETAGLVPHDDDYEEPITLPQSTHTLLFTQPLTLSSIGIWFAGLIAAVSYTCLILALVNNLHNGSPENPLNVPVAVEPPVRVAQYLAMFIGMLMEEEIPTGLYLLRKIPRRSLTGKFPHLSYGRFVLSALVRIVSGYLFLLNVLLVAIQAEDVLDIFYDVLALQFVQQLDDIAFHLAKMDALGKRLRRAANHPCFRTEFERQPFRFRRKLSIFTKIIYFLNFILIIASIALVHKRQNSGYYQCASITVLFGDDIWEEAVVRSSSGEYSRRVLVYSYFNGVYKKSGTYNGRPIYKEMAKYNGNPEFEVVVGAEIIYCREENAWVFTHQDIRKSLNPSEDAGCPWLVRSPETYEYNLLKVPAEWSVWVGLIVDKAQMNVVCNECHSSADCNLNGHCIDKKCQCNDRHVGTRCEHDKPCDYLRNDIRNETLSIIKFEDDIPVLEYSRPVYSYDDVLNDIITDGLRPSLVYTGSRWFGVNFIDHYNWTTESKIQYVRNFHGFWASVYTNKTLIISDPSTESSPVGVDFYKIGKKGKQYGPYGVLHPMQEPPGSGLFYCVNEGLGGRQGNKSNVIFLP